MKWVRAKFGRPEPGLPFLYRTVNSKYMVGKGDFNPRFEDRQMTDHFVDKFGITHWCYIEEPKDEDSTLN